MGSVSSSCCGDGNNEDPVDKGAKERLISEETRGVFDTSRAKESSRSLKGKWIKAVESGNVNVVAVLNEEFPEILVETIFPDGDRALHKSIRNKDNKLAFFLLDCGAHPSAPNATTGDTPLHIAVHDENFNLISLLLSHHANPDLINTFGESPVDMARRKNNQNLLAILSPAAQFVFDHGVTGTTQNEPGTFHSTAYVRELSWESIGSELFEGEDTPERTWCRAEQLIENLRPPPRMRQAKSVPIFGEDTANPPITRMRTTLQHEPSDSEYRRVEKDVLDIFAEPTEEEKRRLEEKYAKPTPKHEHVHGVVNDAHTRKYLDRIDHIREEQQQLTDLSGWLDKRRPKPPYNWQRRWILVNGSYILWSDRQIMTTNATNPKERKRFNQSLSFMMINSIEPVSSRSGCKFKVTVRFSRSQKGPRDYEFKAKTRTDRDFWVTKLNEHKRHYDEVLSTLESS